MAEQGFTGSTGSNHTTASPGAKRAAFRSAVSMCAAVAVTALPISVAAAEVPWAAPAPAKPRAPAVDKEWEGVKFTIDKDEWRETPRRHRFVHGCFTPLHLCMSLYLPPKEKYRGRFVNHMEGGSGGLDKLITQQGWDWAFNSAFDDMGAYLVETNEGHWPDEGSGLDNPRELWIANAHAVRVSRTIAEEMYGRAPARGYITGCSGGGMRSELGLVNNPDLYDGAVPQSGHGGASSLAWGAYSRMGTLLGKEGVARMVDAADVGGSGAIFDGLTTMQREALSEFLRLGYPRDAISSVREYWAGSAPVMLTPGFAQYLQDFWTKPGFLGFDNKELLKPLLVETEVTVDHVFTGRELQAGGPSAMGVGAGRNPATATYGPAPAGKDILDSKTAMRINYPDVAKLFLARATIQTGPDAGKVVYLQPSMSGNANGMVQAYLPRSPWAFDNVKDGDKLKIDNRDYVAFMYIYRHLGEALTFFDFPEMRNAPNRMMPEYQQLLTTYNQAIYPQVEGPTSSTTRGKEGSINPHQKMIYLSGTSDEAMWPAYIETHLRKIRTATPNVDNRFRMWWMESVPHCSGPLTGPLSTNRVNVHGFVSQALVDVMNWAERGTLPPASTKYRFVENGIILAPTAAERKSIQPVVKLSANGGSRAEVAVGTPVRLTANADVPAGTGALVRAEWDFDGKGVWPKQEAAVSGARGAFSTTYTYDKPGTYFPAFRVASRRAGVSPTSAPVYNIARARVIVK